MPKLLFQGHASFRLTSDEGRVIYVDPYAGKGYDAPADIILITHRHYDHSRLDLCAQKHSCRAITSREALADGRHNRFDMGGVLIQAVEARSLFHSPKKCVGYIVGLDGVKIYFSGDTSRTRQMEAFQALELDYAIFPGAGILSMGLEEAAECAALIGARHNIIVHLKPGALFDRRKAEKWSAPNKLIVEPGQEIDLK